ncbi:MAG: outer membrane protein transport protein [Oligoflexia bacterium]|nr:outer membrane protein transport protein [Oligoflexia bacterium]
MNQFAALLIFLSFTSQANASLWNQYGYGARNIALGNSTASLPTDAFSQAYNPALMAFQTKPLFSMGLQGAVHRFEPIKQVLVDRTDLGGASNQVSDVSTNVPDVFSLTLGLQSPLSKSERPFHLGATLSAPVQNLMLVDTQDAYLPQYVMYLSDSQRLTSGFSLATKFSDRFALGVGVNAYLVQGTSARTRLIAGGNSSARIKMEITPGLAPTAGMIFIPGENPKENPWKFGLSYLAKQESRSKVDFTNTISLLAPADLIMTGKNTLYYDPETFILAVSRKDESDSISFSANWEKWGGYEGTAMVLQFTTFTGSFRQVLPPMKYNDIITLHSGYEHRFENFDLRLGYAFLPTPVPDQSGENNALDTDKHQGFLGAGKSFDVGFLDNPLQLDLCGFAHYLVPKDVRKTVSTFIGAPGYKIGGMIYGYALTATAEF